MSVASGCGLPQPPTATPSRSPIQLIEAGHDLLAKAALSPIVEAEPDNATAAWLLSKALAGLDDLDAALALAEKSVALDPDNAAYHVQLGAVLGRMAEKASIFKQLGLARRARKELEAAIALDPRNPDGVYGLLLYYHAAPSFLGGDKAKSAEFADRLSAIDRVRGLLARAAVAHDLKDLAGELNFILQATAADAANFDAQSALAQYHLDRPQPDWHTVEDTACRLLELDPARPDGWRALAEFYVSSLCWTELEQVLTTSAQFNPEDLSPYYSAAAAMIRAGERLPVARAYLEKYLSQPVDGGEPSHALARKQLATLQEKESAVR